MKYFNCIWRWNCHTVFLLWETDVWEVLYKVCFQVPFFCSFSYLKWVLLPLLLSVYSDLPLSSFLWFCFTYSCIFLPVFRILSVFSVFWFLLSSSSCGLAYFLLSFFKNIASLYYVTVSGDLHQLTLFSMCQSFLMLFICTPTILNCVAKIKKKIFPLIIFFQSFFSSHFI